MMFLLVGCEVKNYTPEMPLAFTYNVKVTSGDFSYTGKISRAASGEVELRVTSTSANGLVMNYDGKELKLKYADYTRSVNASAFERSNAAIVLYEVFDYINNSPDLLSKKLDKGYRYDGKASLGDFMLIQNDDNTFKSLTVKSADFKIEFIN